MNCAHSLSVGIGSGDGVGGAVGVTDPPPFAEAALDDPLLSVATTEQV